MILLDTHAYFWFVCGVDKLPDDTRALIESEQNVSISIATFWELTIKSSLGKLKLPVPVSTLMANCAEDHFSILPITDRHLTYLSGLPWIHRDPFDRLIIAQAMAEDMTILTMDGIIPQYPVKTLW